MGSILDLLFPRRCIFCMEFLDKGEEHICRRCADELPFIPGERRLKKGEFFDFCASSLYYTDKVRGSVLRYKFRGKSSYARGYGRILAETVSGCFPDGYDVLSWVPVSARRLRERGYDQAELLCRETAKNLGRKPEKLLEKHRDTPAQSGLSGGEKRRANVLGAYRVTDKEKVRGKRILLIDDVITTGSTLSECSRELLMAGAESVICASLARKE